MSEIEKKSEKKVEFSWWPFWVAGWMFTLGLGAFDFASMSHAVWYEQVLGVLLSWFLWPIFLGLHFAG